VRDQVNAALEGKRRDKVITSSLSARVTVAAPGDVLALLVAHRDELPALFGVSRVDLDEADAVTVRVEKADGVKCQRCWRIVDQVSGDAAFAGVCARCVDALAEPVNG
jgi:isoleucyl-tRNA synthetase